MKIPANKHAQLRISKVGVKDHMRLRGYYSFLDLAAAANMKPWALRRAINRGFSHRTLSILVRLLQPETVDDLLIWESPPRNKKVAST